MNVGDVWGGFVKVSDRMGNFVKSSNTTHFWKLLSSYLISDSY